MNAIELFKALSGDIRLRCLSLLLNNNELCVCELTYALDLPQPKISHHLGPLRKAGLVIDRKEGLWIYYQINPELPIWVSDILQTTITGIKQQSPYYNDQRVLFNMPNRPISKCCA